MDKNAFFVPILRFIAIATILSRDRTKEHKSEKIYNDYFKDTDMIKKLDIYSCLKFFLDFLIICEIMVNRRFKDRWQLLLSNTNFLSKFEIHLNFLLEAKEYFYHI